MGSARVSLKRSKTGVWQGRKEIPEGIRAAYGKREEKASWPAHLTYEQALSEYLPWRATIEGDIDLHKKKAAGFGLVRLTRQQAKALAADWYRAVARGDDDSLALPGWHVDWQGTRDNLFGEQYDPETGDYRLVPGPILIDERDELLVGKGLSVTDDSAAMLLEELAELYLAYLDRLQRRDAGDRSIDPALASLPAPDASIPPSAPQAPKAAPSAAPSAAVSIKGLFERYAGSGAANPRTVSKWRPHVLSFVEHIGHDDVTRVKRSDLTGWTEALVARGLAVKTITDSYIPAVRVSLALAYEDELIPANPASGLKVRGPKTAETHDKDHSDEAAKAILKAAMKGQPNTLPERHRLARRWVPWICAYTGARVGEITQLRAMDIRQEEGVWVFRITPEAGSTKDSKARSVPIHSHLIEQGVIALARTNDATPLFYDVPKGGGSKVNPLPKQRASKLAAWVRSLGVTTPQPNHGWRHRFKTVARSVGIPAEERDAIQGHVPRTEGEKYGKQPLENLRAAIEKLPRYETGLSVPPPNHVG